MSRLSAPSGGATARVSRGGDGPSQRAASFPVGPEGPRSTVAFGSAGPGDIATTERMSARDTILALAIDVIDREGEVGIRVNHLAEQAGVTPPTLYRHFGSRDGLVVAAQAERYVRSLRATMVDVAPFFATCRSREKVRVAMAQLFAQFGDHAGEQRRRERLNVLGGAYARPALQEAIAKAQQGANASVTAVLRDLQGRGLVVATLEVEAMAAWVCGVILGRALIELEGSTVSGAAWNRITSDAVCAVLFGLR
jgi:AcrR family transcriptional regulator